MMINKLNVLQITVLLLFPVIVNCQSISLDIKNSVNEFCPSDTIFLEITNFGDIDYVYKISLLFCIDNEWHTIEENIFDEERFLNKKYPINLMRRIIPNSIDNVEFLPMNQIHIDDIRGKYRFQISFREYNKPDQLFYEIDSEKFLITRVE